MKVPVMFYNVPEGKEVNSLNEIMVTIKGKRSLLHEVDKHNPSVHLDASFSSDLEQEVSVSYGDILLPNSVNLVTYSPETIKIALVEEQVPSD